jgi:uncharacterized protein (DUF58 family)
VKALDPKVLATLSGFELRARTVMEGLLSGIHESPFHGLSVEFSDYRNYQPGDALSHVDWRLYARSERLYVKRFEEETSARTHVLCDRSASMAYRGAGAWGSKLECATVLAAALAWLLIRQRDAVGLLTLSGEDEAEDGRGVGWLPPAQKPSQLGEILRRLNALAPAGAAPVDALLARAARLLHRRSLLLVVSDFLAPPDALEAALRRLRFDGHDVVAVQVLDGDEIDFPFAEGALFEDPETGDRREVDPSRARERYLERFRGFQAELADRFRRLGVARAVVRTDADPARALASLLVERSRARWAS